MGRWIRLLGVSGSLLLVYRKFSFAGIRCVLFQVALSCFGGSDVSQQFVYICTGAVFEGGLRPFFCVVQRGCLPVGLVLVEENVGKVGLGLQVAQLGGFDVPV